MNMVFKISLYIILVNVGVITLWKCEAGFQNVALHKPAYQTNTYVYGAVASGAVDGNTSPIWTSHGTCTATSTAANVSWEVDLGKIYVIDHVITYNREGSSGNRLQEVEVYVGLVREEYNLQAYQPGLAGSILVLVMDDMVYGRWVKITRRTPNELLTLCEVQVMERNDSIRFANIALNKPAYQTEDGPDDGVSGATVDVDTTQTWMINGTCSATNTGNVSLEVDLGNFHHIDHVVIYNRQDDARKLQKVEVYVGPDRKHYSLKAYHHGQAGPIIVLQLDGVVHGRWVKINRKSPNDVLTLCFKVIGRGLFTPFKKHIKRQVLGSPLRILTVDHHQHCCFVCRQTPGCDGAQYVEESGNCTLMSTSSSMPSTDEDHVYLEMQ